ncbi:MAG: ribbon-helix-helix domain-containing protein [Alphaproteobacteria bacterium]|uniref:Ribbon-helix-helix domain-containing protein n=1 Tax=Candidatus Nitrobium versatile TaxID=2884831 RepID=A0A953M101_9BACT|nr:ribbon-helix-helix domain-containing protein [Candidatus Nitrobium versatile]
MKHYQRWLYGKTKIAVTSDEEYIDQLDAFVSKDIFQNRSQAIQEAVKEKLARLNKDEERMLKKLSEHFHEDKFLCGRGFLRS